MYLGLLQDYTLVEEEDKCVNIKRPKEALRKCQFTMYVVMNAGKGSNKHGWVDSVCKGAGKKVDCLIKNFGTKMWMCFVRSN